MRRNKLLKYGLIAGGAYLAYQWYQKSQAPVVAVTPAATTAAPPAVAGLGYFPSGADRPFARLTMPGAGMPFSRYSHGVRWWN